MYATKNPIPYYIIMELQIIKINRDLRLRSMSLWQNQVELIVYIENLAKITLKGNQLNRRKIRSI